MPTTNNNLYNNRYTNRRNTYEEYPQPTGVYTDEQIANVRYDAYGRPYWISPTNQNNPLNELQRDGMNILSVNVQIPNTYAKYKLEKVFPNVSDDRIDDVLDDEWNYFGPDITSELRTPGVTGEFKTAFEINTPIDLHAAYILYGPSKIESRIAAGQLADDVIRNTFCVFFIRDSRAYPIPDYKTLEVMLVENGKTYSDIKEASIQEMKEYDFALDGTFVGDQTATTTPDPAEEFQFRTLLNRSNEWTTLIRYKSGYRPVLPFKRDPGDYIKPTDYVGTSFNQADLFVNEDPTDTFFDTAFQSQTYKEKLRERFEGKMIIYNWPVPYNNNDAYAIGDINNPNDDLSRRLRIMIHGYWKQVTDPLTIQLYATQNGYDLSELKASTNVTTTTTVNPNGFLPGIPNVTTTSTPTLPAGDLVNGENGMINLLVKAGGITVITDLSYTFAPIWNDFPHIYDVDDVGPDDYLEYIDYWSNGNNMFDLYWINPYEPKGSVSYYPLSRLLILQQQLVEQWQIDAISTQIDEIWLQVTTNFTSIENILKSIPNNLTTYTAAVLGPGGDIYKILNASDGWKFVKRKRNDDIKVLDDRVSFFKLLEKNPSIFAKFDRSEENKIVYISNWGRTIEQDRLRDLKDSNAGEWTSTAAQNVAGLFAGVGGTAALIAAPTTVTLSGGATFTVVSSTAAATVATTAGIGLLVVAGAATLWAGLQVIMGEALGDKYELPRNKFIYPSSVDRMASLMNEDYTDAMILNETGPTANLLYNNAVAADDLIITLRAAADSIKNVLNDINMRISTAEGVDEFTAILSDLTAIQQALDSYNSTAIPIITSAKLVVDTYAKQQMQKYYTAIEYVRQKVYNEVLINNSRGILWPESSRYILSKYLPGKTFDNYIP